MLAVAIRPHASNGDGGDERHESGEAGHVADEDWVRRSGEGSDDAGVGSDVGKRAGSAVRSGIAGSEVEKKDEVEEIGLSESGGQIVSDRRGSVPG